MTIVPIEDHKFYGIRYVASYILQGRMAQVDDDDLMDQINFLALLAEMRGKYDSQLGQDIFALCMGGFKHGGYFVECGAHHGRHLSNTAMLERDYSWHGLLIEPNPIHLDSLKARRAKHISKAAWNKSGERLTFRATADSALANLAAVTPNDKHDRSSFETIEVDTMTLNDILASEGAPAVIDFMSIDIEGAELEVLEGLDLNRWDVKVMTLEHNDDPDRAAAFTQRLAPFGFERVFIAASDFDAYYAKPDCLERWRKLYRDRSARF